MTRDATWQGHAEIGDTLFFDVPSTIANTTVQARSGSRSWRGSGPITPSRNLTTAIGEFYFAFGFFFDGNDTDQDIVRWKNGSTILGGLRLQNATGLLRLFTDTGTIVATGTHSLQINTWYWIEIWVDIGNSPNGNLQVRLDGLTEVSYLTNDTQPGADTTVDNIQWVLGRPLNFWYIDDIVFNDTAGGADDSWPGDTRFKVIRPNAAGDVTGLTVTGVANNWDAVDETPPDDDTTYVSDSVVDDYDLYNMAATSGLSGMTIIAAQAEAIARSTAASGDSIALGIKTDGTEYNDSDVALTTSYRRIMGTRRTVNPFTTAAWSSGELDAIQEKVRIR